MKKSDLDLAREKLEARREAILGERGRSMRRIEESTCDPAADPVDRAAGNCDFDVAVGQAHIESEEFVAVEEALEKISLGSYGICEECDEQIGERRLFALPSARFCIDCQRQFEEGGLDLVSL